MTSKCFIFIQLCIFYSASLNIASKTKQVFGENQGDLESGPCRLELHMNISNCKTPCTNIELLDKSYLPEGTVCLHAMNGTISICSNRKWTFQALGKSKKNTINRRKRFLMDTVSSIVHAAGHIVEQGAQTVAHFAGDVASGVARWFGGASHSSGQSSIYSANRPPTVTCPMLSQKEYVASEGEAGVHVSWQPATANDGTIGVMQTQGLEPGNYFLQGTHLITYIAKDASGLMGSCSFSFEVKVLSCPFSYTYLPHGHTMCYPEENKNIFGSTCTYSCDNGFEITGKNNVQCLASQSWDALKPSCQASSCRNPPIVLNGNFTCASPNYAYNSICTLVCASGYLRYQNDFITCQSYQQWSTPGTCNDVEPPTIDCSPDIEAFYGPQFSKVNVTWDEPIVKDNSGQTHLTSNIPSGSSFENDNTVVIFTAVDNSHNYAECKKIVRLQVKRCPDYVKSNNSDVFCSHGNAYGSVCTTICQQAYELVSVSTQTCQENQSWSGEKPQCKPRPCPHVPHVRNGNYSCPTGTNYQDVCLLQCNAGFTAQAPLTITCNINVTWSQVGSCLDTQPPVFTNGCPDSIVHEAASLGSPTYVSYNLPKVADNSNEVITIHGYPISGSDFHQGTTTVTVNATDQQGNNAICTFNITVILITCNEPDIDTSGKDLINYTCPDQYVYGASCFLNCKDGNPINGSSSIKCDKQPPSNALQWLWMGNVKPNCNALACKKLHAPDNGALTCDTLGVGREVCTLVCNINFTILLSTPAAYICLTGHWTTSSVPSCSARHAPNNLEMKPTFYYYSGACSSNNTMIKDTFLQILNDSKILNMCGDNDCTVDTLEVTCGAVTQRRKKKNVDSFKYTIATVINIGKYKDHGSPSETLEFYQSVVNSINDEINLAADSGKFNIPIGTFETFIYGESLFTCNEGESLVYSSMSCAGCGPGFIYNNVTKKCDTCPQGTYQEQDVSLTCTKCPDGTTTRTSMSTSVTDCQNLCLPGSISKTGFQNCTLCPQGKFTSQYGMKECQLCPYGMSTMTTGASSIQSCLFSDFRINENTSRPAIQISDEVPKKFTFMAWISDVSSFQTSTLIFSIKSPSDNSAALVLDTISLHIERNADVTLRKLRKWNHVALVYTSPNVTLFVNGQHVETLSAAPVAALYIKDISFRSSSVIKSILVSGMQMTRTAYTESQIKEFSSSCSRQVDKHELAYKPWESLVTSQVTCNDKDLCTDEPCGPYGVCVSGTDTLTCICDDPWTGDRCEIAPDYCVGHHCANGSTCLNQPHDKGYSCLCPNFYKGALCNEPHFPVDGGWGRWAHWSSCSVQCGTGQRSRTRQCDSPPAENGGLSCQGEQNQTETCEINCKDCRWGEWTQWTCSVSCDADAGVETRTRSIASEAVKGGQPCSGPKTNIRRCTVSPCPVHGGFGAWEEWSGCSISCGGGVSIRRRSCDNPFPAHGGNMCNETLAEETKHCNTQECPVCKLPELREGQTKWNCSTDEAGMQTCNIVCSPGLVLMPTTYNIFQCGPVTNYTWSQQTPDNPVGLTPSCSDQKTPESISSVITTTFDVDCSQESLTLGIRNHVHEQLTRDECFSKNNCFHTVDTHSSCKTSKKRSIGTMVLNVSLNSVGNDTDSAYFGGLKEEDIEAQRMKVLSFEKVVEDIFTKNETIFTATVDGVTYRGQIQSVEARFICQPGSGFVGGMCVDCPAGTYSPGNGSCLYCDKGFYQDKANSAVCEKCPTGTTTSGRGSYSLNHCTTNPLTYLDVYPYQFYPSPNKETPNKQHPNHKDDGVSTTIVIAAVTSSVTFLLVLGVVVFILIKKYGQSISKTAPEGYIDLHVSSVEGTK